MIRYIIIGTIVLVGIIYLLPYYVQKVLVEVGNYIIKQLKRLELKAKLKLPWS